MAEEVKAAVRLCLCLSACLLVRVFLGDRHFPELLFHDVDRFLAHQTVAIVAGDAVAIIETAR